MESHPSDGKLLGVIFYCLLYVKKIVVNSRTRAMWPDTMGAALKPSR